MPIALFRKALLPLLLPALSLAAQSHLWYPMQVAISPDGKLIAWTEYAHSGLTLELAAVEDVKHPQILTPREGCTEQEITWSPDSSALAFLANCPETESGAEKEQPSSPQLYLANLSDRAKPMIRVLTAMKGYAQLPTFSPDGSSIAFLFVPNATRPAGALAAMKPWAGVIGHDNIEVQQLATVSTAAKEPAAPRLVTPAALHVYEYDWSPDSKAVTYIAAEPPGENNWWVAKLYTQALGGEPKAIFAPSESKSEIHGLQVAVPRWSPDSKYIAFIGGLMSDQGSTGGDIFLVPAEGGSEPINLTPKRPSTPKWIDWGNSGQLWFTELNGGSFELHRLHFEGVPFQHCEKPLIGCGVFAPLTEAAVYSLEGNARDGRLDGSVSPSSDHRFFAMIASSMNQPPEIYLAIAAMKPDLRPLTRQNIDSRMEWGKTESLSWTNDGYKVQGWLTYPKDYDKTKSYPLLVLVHGGPAAAAVSNWGGRGALSPATFSEHGYFVLVPNPRGSYGQGEEFVKANRKDFGYGDLRDILKGLDAAEAKVNIDPKRVGLLGWSYGGFMTMFGVTQTDRFHAAVAGAGIANWQSYYGENSIDQWMIPYFGASVYDDPAVYAKSSAINFIHAARTPTLVVVGDRDGECPAPQSFEFWHALRDQGTPTELVVYPNEGHSFRSPEHLHDLSERVEEWFAKYLPAK